MFPIRKTFAGLGHAAGFARWFASAAIFLFLPVSPIRSVAADAPATAETPSAPEPSFKFGLYLHFGVATFAHAGETGEIPAERFAPTALDVRSWVHAAKLAGMTYAVLTAKHTSGFCLWASKVDDYSVAHSPYKGDIIADFIAACKAEGILPGLHYSIPDAHIEGSVRARGAVSAPYFNIIKQQITELFTTYPDIRVQTFDVSARLSPDQYAELRATILSLDPRCVFIDNAHDPRLVSASVINGWMWSAQAELLPAQQLFTRYNQAFAASQPFLLGVGPDASGKIPSDQMTVLMQVKDLIAQSPAPAPAAENPSPPAAPVTLDDLKQGLILYYNFDTKPVNGKITDLSGHNNDGKATGIEWVPQGHRGGSVSFGKSDSYITVPNNDGLNPPRFTLAAWIKTNFKDYVWRRIFDKEFNVGYDLTMGGGGQEGVPGNLNNRQGQFSLEVAQGSAGSGIEVTDGRWHLVVGTFDGAHIQLYVDGQPCGKGSAAKGNPAMNLNDLTIGANRSNPKAIFGEVDASFNGQMDDVMMYNRALSAAEVQALYNFRRTPADANSAIIPH